MKKGKIEERGKNDESKAHKTALYAKIQKKKPDGVRSQGDKLVLMVDRDTLSEDTSRPHQASSI